MRSKPAIIGLLVPLLLIAAALLALGVYDYTQRDTIAKGVTVSGIALGGLDREQAIERLNAQLIPALERPVEIDMDGRTFRLGPRESRVAADIDATVDNALRAGRTGLFFVRAASTLVGVERDEDVKPDMTYSEAAVKRVVRRVLKGTSDRPVDAHIAFTPERGFKVVEARDGVTIDTARLQREVRTALADPGANRHFRPQAQFARAKVRLADLAKTMPTVVAVDRERFTLTLYKDLEREKRYSVAVGKAGLETPPGRYSIANKQIDPAWHVPNSDWAGELKGKVIPPDDPRNPIAARWLGIADGIGIHGTYEPASIGSQASHGCIRMRISDVKDLYERVPVGSIVYIS